MKKETKRAPWNLGKRKPEKDENGLSWCVCIHPKLTSPGPGGRGQAYCLLCHAYWYN